MKKLLMTICLLSIHQVLFAKDVNIYIDADYTVHKESAQGIELGIRAAIAEESNSQFKFNVIPLDHRGNTRRSLANFKKVINDKTERVVFGGLHSPPLISNRDFINKNKVLTLVPWAAGAPITRGDSKNNWIYRLSVDDAQAGGFISSWAVNKYKCKRPRLVLEKTGWGKSNQRNMGKDLKKRKLSFDESWFNWGISSEASQLLIKSMKKAKNDCVFFVGNSKDAFTIFNTIGEILPKIKIFSHWGIVGGKTARLSALIKSRKLHVEFIQSNFSFRNKKQSKFQKSVWNKLTTNFPHIKTPQDIPRESGFVHSYDLTKLYIKALKEKSTTSIRKRIENVRDVQGLIKNYKRPFSPTKNNLNGHEALSSSNYIMAKFNDNGQIELLFDE